MPKFFAPQKSLRDGFITFSGKDSDHLRVLRVREGEELTVCDGEGLDAQCVVEMATKDTYRLRILKTVPSAGEPTVSVSVYAALPKGDKTELIVQKAVELGADEIVFFLSSRCVARPDDKAAAARVERLCKVAEASAMQSLRGRIPEVRWLPDFGKMLAEAAEAELGAFLWEEARSLSLRSLLQTRGEFRTGALITGPEGGFSEEEAAQAEAAGLRPVTLGPRILRCETAPLCALSALMYETGNLG